MGEGNTLEITQGPDAAARREGLITALFAIPFLVLPYLFGDVGFNTKGWRPAIVSPYVAASLLLLAAVSFSRRYRRVTLDPDGGRIIVVRGGLFPMFREEIALKKPLRVEVSREGSGHPVRIVFEEGEPFVCGWPRDAIEARETARAVARLLHVGLDDAIAP